MVIDLVFTILPLFMLKTRWYWSDIGRKKNMIPYHQMLNRIRWRHSRQPYLSRLLVNYVSNMCTNKIKMEYTKKNIRLKWQWCIFSSLIHVCVRFCPGVPSSFSHTLMSNARSMCKCVMHICVDSDCRFFGRFCRFWRRAEREWCCQT